MSTQTLSTAFHIPEHLPHTLRDALGDWGLVKSSPEPPSPTSQSVAANTVSAAGILVCVYIRKSKLTNCSVFHWFYILQAKLQIWQTSNSIEETAMFISLQKLLSMYFFMIHQWLNLLSAADSAAGRSRITGSPCLQSRPSLLQFFLSQLFRQPVSVLKTRTDIHHSAMSQRAQMPQKK